MSFQTKNDARRWRDPQVASQKLAVFGAGRGKECHCWGGPEGCGTPAGSALLQCHGVCWRSVARTREVLLLQQTHSAQNSLAAQHLPAAERTPGRSTTKTHAL